MILTVERDEFVKCFDLLLLCFFMLICSSWFCWLDCFVGLWFSFLQQFLINGDLQLSVHWADPIARSQGRNTGRKDGFFWVFIQLTTRIFVSWVQAFFPFFYQSYFDLNFDFSSSFITFFFFLYKLIIFEKNVYSLLFPDIFFTFL